LQPYDLPPHGANEAVARVPERTTLTAVRTLIVFAVLDAAASDELPVNATHHIVRTSGLTVRRSIRTSR